MNAAAVPRPAYFVIEVKITDAQGIRPYQAQVEATYKAFGGERIVVGETPEPLEGEPPTGVIVILRFPSLAQAHAWHASESYQAILGHRLASADSRAYFVEGIA